MHWISCCVEVMFLANTFDRCQTKINVKTCNEYNDNLFQIYFLFQHQEQNTLILFSGFQMRQ